MCTWTSMVFWVGQKHLKGNYHKIRWGENIRKMISPTPVQLNKTGILETKLNKQTNKQITRLTKKTPLIFIKQTTQISRQSMFHLAAKVLKPFESTQENEKPIFLWYMWRQQPKEEAPKVAKNLKLTPLFIEMQYLKCGASVIWVWQLKAGEQTVLLPSEPDRGDL